MRRGSVLLLSCMLRVVAPLPLHLSAVSLCSATARRTRRRRAARAAWSGSAAAAASPAQGPRPWRCVRTRSTSPCFRAAHLPSLCGMFWCWQTPWSCAYHTCMQDILRDIHGFMVLHAQAAARGDAAMLTLSPRMKVLHAQPAARGEAVMPTVCTLDSAACMACSQGRC